MQGRPTARKYGGLWIEQSEISLQHGRTRRARLKSHQSHVRQKTFQVGSALSSVYFQELTTSDALDVMNNYIEFGQNKVPSSAALHIVKNFFDERIRRYLKWRPGRNFQKATEMLAQILTRFHNGEGVSWGQCVGLLEFDFARNVDVEQVHLANPKKEL